jgi:hypothetical protein
MDQHLSVLRRESRIRRWYMAVALAILNMAAFHMWLAMQLMHSGDPAFKKRYFLRVAVANCINGLLTFARAAGHIYRPFQGLGRGSLHEVAHRLLPEGSHLIEAVFVNGSPSYHRCHVHGRQGSKRQTNAFCRTCNRFLCWQQCFKRFHTTPSYWEPMPDYRTLELPPTFNMVGLGLEVNDEEHGARDEMSEAETTADADTEQLEEIETPKSVWPQPCAERFKQQEKEMTEAEAELPSWMTEMIEEEAGKAADWMTDMMDEEAGEAADWMTALLEEETTADADKQQLEEPLPLPMPQQQLIAGVTFRSTTSGDSDDLVVDQFVEIQ